MILIVLAAICMISVPLAGGSLSRLADLQLRWLWMAPVALGVQVVIVTIAPGGNRTVHALIHIGTYVLIGLFLWRNRKIAGAPLIAVGVLANATAIVANGGVMPASINAQRLAGLIESGGGFHNSAALLHPHLLWLGDIIPVPGPLPNVLSPGDCIIFAGMLLLLHRTTRRRRVQMQPIDPCDPAQAETASAPSLERALAGR